MPTPSPPPSSPTISVPDPSSYLTPARFHRSLTLPPSTIPGSIHPKLRVTFAVCGAGVDDLIVKNDPTGGFKNRDGEKEIPTILYCGGMFGSRYQGIQGCDFMGKMVGVRIVFVDRPGLGGSTRVDVPLRIPVWLETVPVLMELLGVKHVALVSHSCGSLYLLNTLYHLRHILSPTKPYVALMAPWVHPSLSHAKLMRLVHALPTSLLQNWSPVNSFIASSIAPTLSASDTFISSLTSLIPSTKSSTDQELALSAKADELTGQTKKLRDEIQKVAVDYVFKEDTSVVEGETILCLKKLGVGYWGVCEDLPQFVEMLVKLEKDKQVSIGEASGGSEKLRIEAFFGETDRMIEKRGEAVFRNCFREEVCGDVLEFEGIEIEGADHESVVNVHRGAFERIFEGAKEGLV